MVANAESHAMGKGFNFMLKSIKNYFYRYNAENRAHKFIDKEKLPVAPFHPKTEKIYKQIQKKEDDIYKEIEQKNPELDKHLQQVYLKSEGKNEELRTSRPLPQNRFVDETGVIFVEPLKTQEGFTTVSRVVKIITDHNGDPNLWSASAVAAHYKLDKNKVENIFKYYRTFNIYTRDLETEEDAARLLEETAPIFKLVGKNDEDKKEEKESKK